MSPRLRVIYNKIDLASAWELSTVGEAVKVSAKAGAGIEELCHAISSWLVPRAPAKGDAVPFTPSLCARIDMARQHYEAGRITASRAELEFAAAGL